MDYEEVFIDAFLEFDSEGDDFINSAELHHVNDGSGTHVRVCEMKCTNYEEKLIEASQVFDRDGCDFINSADLRHVMTTLKTKRCWGQ